MLAAVRRRRAERGRAAAPLPAPLLVVAAIISVQVGSAIAAGIFPDVGPAGAVLLRLALAAVVACALTRPRLPRGRPGALVAVLGFGAVLAGMNWSFYAALDRIPLGIAVTVEFTGPLAVAVAGSRRWIDGLWVLLAAAGVVMLTHGEGPVDTAGLALALLAGAFWAGYILLSQRVGRMFPGTTGLALALAVGAVLTLPAGVAAGGPSLFEPRVLATGLSVALLSSVIPYSFELTALRRLPAAAFGVLMSLEPAMAAMAGFVVLGQRLRVGELVAIAFVCVASVGVTVAARS